MRPRAIETRYKGYRFRSRLEARWAVFFDHLGLRWEYEPEGFELPGGVRYLPDFRIGGTWFEVKPGDYGDNPLLGEILPEKHQRLALEMDCPVVLLEGPPAMRAWRVYERFSTDPDPGFGDFGLAWDALFFVDPSGKYAPWHRARTDYDAGCLPDWYTPGMFPKVEAAIAAARGARFEHGESGPRGGLGR